MLMAPIRSERIDHPARPGQRATDGDAEVSRVLDAHRSRRHSVQPSLVSGTPLTIVGQPIYSLSVGRIVGYEALSRFPALPDWTPDGVFRLAAEQGVGLELEEEAIRRALDHLKKIRARDGFLTINASPAAAVTSSMRRLLEQSPVEAVVLEITEQVPVDSYIALNRALLKLRVDGLRVAIDDAGSGFANWGHLVHLQPDIIKLDGAWTAEVDSDPVRQAMVRALISFAREIDALVVAEKVETPAQLTTMRELGVDLAQGYLLCRPEPFDHLLKRPRLL